MIGSTASRRAPSREAGATSVDEKDRRIAELEAALEPFATFGANNVDEDGWSGREQGASIHTWFGPSEFRAARDALGTKPDAE